MLYTNENGLSRNNSTLQATSTSRNEVKLISTSNFLGREINVEECGDMKRYTKTIKTESSDIHVDFNEYSVYIGKAYDPAMPFLSIKDIELTHDEAKMLLSLLNELYGMKNKETAVFFKISTIELLLILASIAFLFYLFWC